MTVSVIALIVSISGKSPLRMWRLDEGDIGSQDRRDLFGGDLAAIAPFRLAKAEDIAAPVGGDGPTIGEAGIDLAFAVVADEPLRGRIEKRGATRRRNSPPRRAGGGVEAGRWQQS